MPRREVAAGAEGDGAHGIVDHRLERSDVTVRLMQMNPDGFNCSNDKKGAVAEQILMRASAHKVHYVVITELHRPEPERLRVLLNFFGFTRAVYAPRVGEDEADSSHGGVAILIHKDAPCKIVAVGCGEQRDACTDTSIEFPRGGDHVCVAGRALVNDDGGVCCGEFVTVEMLHDDQPFTLRAAYVRPMQPMTAALWDTLLRGADVVAGDFNAVHSTWCSKATLTKGAYAGIFSRGLELNKALSRNGCRVLKLTSTAAGEQRDCTHTAVEATNTKVEGSTIDLFIVRTGVIFDTNGCQAYRILNEAHHAVLTEVGIGRVPYVVDGGTGRDFMASINLKGWDDKHRKILGERFSANVIRAKKSLRSGILVTHAQASTLQYCVRHAVGSMVSDGLVKRPRLGEPQSITDKRAELTRAFETLNGPVADWTTSVFGVRQLAIELKAMIAAESKRRYATMKVHKLIQLMKPTATRDIAIKSEDGKLLSDMEAAAHLSEAFDPPLVPAPLSPSPIAVHRAPVARVRVTEPHQVQIRPNFPSKTVVREIHDAYRKFAASRPPIVFKSQQQLVGKSLSSAPPPAPRAPAASAVVAASVEGEENGMLKRKRDASDGGRDDAVPEVVPFAPLPPRKMPFRRAPHAPSPNGHTPFSRWSGLDGTRRAEIDAAAAALRKVPLPQRGYLDRDDRTQRSKPILYDEKCREEVSEREIKNLFTEVQKRVSNAALVTAVVNDPTKREALRAELTSVIKVDFRTLTATPPPSAPSFPPGDFRGVYVDVIMRARRNQWEERMNGVEPHARTVFTTPAMSIGVSDLRMALQKIGLDGCPDAQGISALMISLLSDEALAIVAELFSRIQATGSMPRMWKRTVIVPIPKDGVAPEKVFTAAGYRPIALTSVFSRMLEHVLMERVRDHAETVLSPQQLAYRQGGDPRMLHHHFFQTVNNSMMRHDREERHAIREQRGCGRVVGLFLDLTNAFNSITHASIIAVLKRRNFPVWFVCFVESWLRDRYQCTRVGDAFSEWRRAGCGGPQGSVLMPLLFSLVLDDFIQAVQKKIDSSDVKLTLDQRAVYRVKAPRGWNTCAYPLVCNTFLRGLENEPPPVEDLTNGQWVAANEQLCLESIKEQPLKGAVNTRPLPATISIHAYADDILILAEGMHTEVLIQALREVLTQDVMKPLYDVGLRISPKSKLMQFRFGYGRWMNGEDHIEPAFTWLHIPGMRSSMPLEIKTDCRVEWLGLTLNPSLQDHVIVEPVSTKLREAVALLNQMGNCTIAQRRQAYLQQGIGGVNYYAALIAGNALGSSAIREAEQLHAKASRLIMGTHESANSEACVAAAGFEPLRVMMYDRLVDVVVAMNVAADQVLRRTAGNVQDMIRPRTFPLEVNPSAASSLAKRVHVFFDPGRRKADAIKRGTMEVDNQSMQKRGEEAIKMTLGITAVPTHDIHLATDGSVRNGIGGRGAAVVHNGIAGRYLALCGTGHLLDISMSPFEAECQAAVAYLTSVVRLVKKIRDEEATKKQPHSPCGVLWLTDCQPLLRALSAKGPMRERDTLRRHIWSLLLQLAEMDCAVSCVFQFSHPRQLRPGDTPTLHENADQLASKATAKAAEAAASGSQVSASRPIDGYSRKSYAQMILRRSKQNINLATKTPRPTDDQKRLDVMHRHLASFPNLRHLWREDMKMRGNYLRQTFANSRLAQKHSVKTNAEKPFCALMARHCDEANWMKPVPFDRFTSDYTRTFFAQLYTGVCGRLGGNLHSVAEKCTLCKKDGVLGRHGDAVTHMFECASDAAVGLRHQWLRGRTNVSAGLLYSDEAADRRAATRYAIAFVIAIGPISLRRAAAVGGGGGAARSGRHNAAEIRANVTHTLALEDDGDDDDRGLSELLLAQDVLRDLARKEDAAAENDDAAFDAVFDVQLAIFGGGAPAGQ